DLLPGRPGDGAGFDGPHQPAEGRAGQRDLVELAIAELPGELVDEPAGHGRGRGTGRHRRLEQVAGGPVTGEQVGVAFGEAEPRRPAGEPLGQYGIAPAGLGPVLRAAPLRRTGPGLGRLLPRL